MPHPTPSPAPGHDPQHRTANDRFKNGFAAWFWAGLTVATLAHMALFVASPTFAIAAKADPRPPLIGHHVPDVPLPPPPEDIPRPAAPVLSAEAPADVTIPQTTPHHNPVDLRPPPPRRGEGLEPGDFTPMTIRPQLRNARDMARALERHYPAPLRHAGIGGTVTVWFLIDVDGRVRDTRINESSGFTALDQAALQVADRMEFTPAYNRDQPVRVWVSIPITFATDR
jgi:periplasmic protein TonB